MREGAMLMRQWQPSDQPQVASASDEFISVSDVTTFLRRYIRSILACLFAGILLALFHVSTTDQIYTARTQILIEPKLPQYLQQQQSGVSTSLDTAQIESQIAVMRSEKIAKMVIDQLALMENPDFLRLRGLTITQKLDRFTAAVLKAIGADPADRPAFLSWPGAAVDSDAAVNAAAELPEFERGRYAIDLFRANLQIGRVGVSYAVEIFFRSRNPELAAEIANATADTFVREQIETKAAAAREGGEWLERRMGEMRTKMNTATQIAQEFRARHDYRVRAPGAKLVNGQVVYEAEDETAPDGPTLEELEVTADTYRQMYESFLLAFTSNLSQQSYPVADARVITAATRPLSASHPRKKLVLAFGMVAGLMSGVGFAFLRHAIDRTVRSPRQVNEDLGLKCLGELPVVRRRKGAGLLDEVIRSPLSPFTENLRRAKSAVRFMEAAGPIRCIGVTSVLPEEGKGIVASNLALLYAAGGMRTLLVDADSEFPDLTRRLAANVVPLRDPDHPSHPRGAAPGIFRRAHGEVDLLPSTALDGNREFSLPALGDYDMVVVNLAPLTSGAERLAISSQLDGVILAVEWGKTGIDMVRELVWLLQAHNASILGVLLTNVKLPSSKPYPRSRLRLLRG
jgi:uncharacterized protein involved in exopolysaccharide biosynthesis/Mrp family chromosome partitioning ATPase